MSDGTKPVPVDLEDVLSLELIRSHTKTDDDVFVSDELLKLYRKAAIEAAEAYTGQKFGSAKTVTENIDFRERFSRFRSAQRIRLKQKAIDGTVMLYGGNLSTPSQMPTQRDGRTLLIPNYFMGDNFTCCHPCVAADKSLKAVYRTGAACGDYIPHGIILGCLKYIAWTIGNPGDELVTMRDRSGQATSGVTGTNNAAIASGAVEEWRRYQA